MKADLEPSSWRSGCLIGGSVAQFLLHLQHFTLRFSRIYLEFVRRLAIVSFILRAPVEIEMKEILCSPAASLVPAPGEESSAQQPSWS